MTRNSGSPWDDEHSGSPGGPKAAGPDNSPPSPMAYILGGAIPTYSYFIPAPGLPIQRQRDLVAARCSELGLTVAEEFCDDAAAGRRPLLRRPKGRFLARAKDGDTVISTTNAMAMSKLEEGIRLFRRLQKAGVKLHLAD